MRGHPIKAIFTIQSILSRCRTATPARAFTARHFSFRHADTALLGHYTALRGFLAKNSNADDFAATSAYSEQFYWRDEIAGQAARLLAIDMAH